MNWYDPLASSTGNGKFSGVSTAVDASRGASPVTVAFFDWLGWALAVAALLTGGAAIVTRNRLFGYLTAVIGVAGAVLAYIAHADVVNLGGGIDHSLGVYADIIGFAPWRPPASPPSTRARRSPTPGASPVR